jgi:hypothetical protein
VHSFTSALGLTLFVATYRKQCSDDGATRAAVKIVYRLIYVKFVLPFPFSVAPSLQFLTTKTKQNLTYKGVAAAESLPRQATAFFV